MVHIVGMGPVGSGDQGVPGQGYNYGNSANVGYSPGQAGGVPADVNKWVFQQRQYEALYGNFNRKMMWRAPIFTASIWTPGILLACYGVLVFANAIDGFFSDFNFVFHWGWFLLTWALALYVVWLATGNFWLVALMNDRRRGGTVTRHMHWVDYCLENSEDRYWEKYPGRM